ncbi:hypothetical protein GOP47_0023726 [Adiantum capillus-veneris]|uniref:Patatin n=1 Tax=Adiantum capillus-veneris TaxID=13818 RepID=A0A9D4U416_ADICA|nr:hypothetical protein GOP47_0023726 [Adiantum capillus-veneris]
MLQAQVSSTVAGLTMHPLNFHGEKGGRITILSIDGGGVRGIIPATQLQCLEKQLQELDGMDARIADYFDVIAGTSTGGLIATLLTTPNGEGRPRFDTEEIISLYMSLSKEVFPPKKAGFFSSAKQLMTMLHGPKYSAKGLESLLLETLKDVKLSNTTTELLIPTFDINLMQPIFFSTSEAKQDKLKNPFLRDVCRGTSAAPTFLPPYFFQTHDQECQNFRDYNLVDGALAENNPAFLSIIHILKENFKGNQKFCKRIKDKDYKSLLVLSLGTGSVSKSYSATDASHWGVLKWVYKEGQVPIVDMCFDGSADMVDFNLHVLFQTLECGDNYLRIQAPNLSSKNSAVDDARDENLENLLQIGNTLLDEQVTTVDVATGKYIPQLNKGSNRDALARFARELVMESRARKEIRENEEQLPQL